MAESSQSVEQKSGRGSLFLAGLAGARKDVLQLLPAAVTKQAAMGAVLLTTAGFAAVSAAYALNITRVIPSPWLCAPVGLLWGLAILNLDRMLVIGLAQEKGIGRNIALALPRVILAFIIGVVISTPLMLKIFESEIDAQLNRSIIEAQGDLQSQIDESPIALQLGAAQERLSEIDRLVNAGDPASSPSVGAVQTEIVALQTKADQEKATYERLLAEALAEEDGTGGTGVAGCADSCQSKKAASAEAQALWQSTRDQIAEKQSEKAGVVAAESEEAIAERPAVVANIEKLKGQLGETQNAGYALEDANTGIIARLKALKAISGNDSTASNAHLAVTLLFMSMEVLPVVFKVISNLGRRSQYDEVVEDREAFEVEAATADLKLRRDRDEIRRTAEMDAEKDRAEKQHEVVKKINAAVVEHQAAVIDEALALWTVHAKDVAALRLNDWSASLAANGSTAPIVAGTNGGFSSGPGAPAGAGVGNVGASSGPANAASGPQITQTIVTGSMPVPPPISAN